MSNGNTKKGAELFAKLRERLGLIVERSNVVNGSAEMVRDAMTALGTTEPPPRYILEQLKGWLEHLERETWRVQEDGRIVRKLVADIEAEGQRIIKEQLP